MRGTSPPFTYTISWRVNRQLHFYLYLLPLPYREISEIIQDTMWPSHSSFRKQLTPCCAPDHLLQTPAHLCLYRTYLVFEKIKDKLTRNHLSH